jgi:molecular chaperone GrpE
MKEKFKHDKPGTDTENDTIRREEDADTAINTGSENGNTMQKEPASPENEVERLKADVQEMKDKYLRLVAEFENFRKRTARESLELRQTAGKEVIVSLLDVLDDSERAEKQLQSDNDMGAIKEGLLLIFGKFRSLLQSKGLKPMQSIGTDFNPDLHEAVAEIPAPAENMKGKVIDEVQKGYYLNDKIIRFAKVVVAK